MSRYLIQSKSDVTDESNVPITNLKVILLNWIMIYGLMLFMQKIESFTKEQKKVLLLSSLGGALEYYDFIIYIFFAHVIEKAFFSQNSSYVATLKTLAIFSIGYLLRPLGGIIFSHFGDRYGRKIVFIFTVLFMAIPSLAMGLLPTTAQIGAAAPVLLLILRMIQGLALGGEIPAALTFVSEHVAGHRQGFSLSTLFVGINLGMLLASGVTTILSSVLSEAELLSYGWRIPFILGGLFGLVSIFLRRYLHETAAFKSLKPADVKKIPFLELMKHSSKQVVLGALMIAVASVCVFIFLYWPQYLHQYFHYDFGVMMRLNTIGTFFSSFSILLGGWLVDRFGFRRVYLLSTGSLVFFSYGLFSLLSLHSLFWVICSYMLLSSIFCILPASYAIILTHLFPTPVRYSGVAMSYNLAYAFFGGLSPLICTVIINYFNSALAPGVYLTFVAAISWSVCYFNKISNCFPINKTCRLGLGPTKNSESC